VLAGPHILNALGAPPPSAGRSRFALTLAQGCRSLSRGDYPPRSGRRRCHFGKRKKKPADPVGPAGFAVSVIVSATHCAEATGPRHPSNPDAGARANDGPNHSAQHVSTISDGNAVNQGMHDIYIKIKADEPRRALDAVTSDNHAPWRCRAQRQRHRDDAAGSEHHSLRVPANGSATPPRAPTNVRVVSGGQ
jgi:hypothetical protein